MSNLTKININYPANVVCIFKALENCDIDYIKKLLALGIDVNYEIIIQSRKITPLIHFFSNVDVYDSKHQQFYMIILKMLLDAGANAKYAPVNNSSPLHVAVRRNLKEAVEILLKFGASKIINHQDDFGNTPLLIASEKGFVNIAELLLEYGADTVIENYENQTALSVAYNIRMTKIIGNTTEEKIKQLEQHIKQLSDDLLQNKTKYEVLEKKYDILNAKCDKISAFINLPV